MIDEGIKLADKKIEDLSKRIDKVYKEAYETAVKNNKKAIEKYAGLTDDALKGLTPEAKKLKREAFKREIARTKAISQNIAAEIAQAGTITSKIIQNEMANVYGLSYDFASFDIQKQSGLRLNFAQYDKNQLSILVQEGQSPFTKIAYKKMGADKVITTRLQNQFMQGVMLGENQQKLVKRIKGVTGQSTRQAKTVAQTERNRVQSQGRNQSISEAVDMGISMSKMWSARMFKTRDTHAEINGDIVKQGEKFGNGLEFPGDPNGSASEVIRCFCVLKPIVNSISSALQKHREKFNYESFKDYQQNIKKQTEKTTKTTKAKEKLTYKTTKEIESMSVPKLKQLTAKLSKEYYPVSGISFGDTTYEQAIEQLQKGATKSDLI